jgi:hypothetical protein
MITGLGPLTPLPKEPLENRRALTSGGFLLLSLSGRLLDCRRIFDVLAQISPECY